MRLAESLSRAGARIALAAALLLACLVGSVRQVRAEDPPGAGARSRRLVAVLVDTSGSMAHDTGDRRTTKIDAVRGALREFLRKLPPEVDVLPATFDAEFRSGAVVRAGTPQGRADLDRFVEELAGRGSETRAWHSLAEVMRIGAAWLEGRKDARVSIHMFTDGLDTTSVTIEEALAPYTELIRSKVVDARCYSLAFDLGAGETARIERAGVTVLAVPDVADLRPPLHAAFECHPGMASTEEDVTFLDRSIGRPTRFHWTFGDGASSTERNPLHRFVTPGSFDVRLEISDDSSGSDDCSYRVVVEAPRRPDASFRFAPERVVAGDPVAFAQCSPDAGAVCRWDFGDGHSGEGHTAVHVFVQAGSYTVRAVVSRRGRESTASAQVEVQSAPGPLLSLAGPNEAETGEPVRLTAACSDTDAAVEWRIGSVVRGTGRTLEVAFDDAGPKEIAATARSPRGETTVSHTVAVAPTPPPTVTFEPGARSATSGQAIRFVPQLHGHVSEVAWHWGDGSAPERRPPPGDAEHAFDRPGSYQVRLAVRGRGGAGEALATVLIVPAWAPAQASFDIVQRSGDPGELDLVNTTEGAVSVYRWTAGPLEQFSTTERKVHTVRLPPGEHVIRLVATPPDGLASSVAERKHVVAAPQSIWRTPLPGLIAALGVAGIVCVIARKGARRAAQVASSSLRGAFRVRNTQGEWVTVRTFGEGDRAPHVVSQGEFVSAAGFDPGCDHELVRDGDVLQLRAANGGRTTYVTLAGGIWRTQLGDADIKFVPAQ